MRYLAILPKKINPDSCRTMIRQLNTSGFRSSVCGRIRESVTNYSVCRLDRETFDVHCYELYLGHKIPGQPMLKGEYGHLEGIRYNDRTDIFSELSHQRPYQSTSCLEPNLKNYFKFILFLNEDFRGGELEFDERNPYSGTINTTVVRPQTGLLCITKRDL